MAVTRFLSLNVTEDIFYHNAVKTNKTMTKLRFAYHNNLTNTVSLNVCAHDEFESYKGGFRVDNIAKLLNHCNRS